MNHSILSFFRFAIVILTLSVGLFLHCGGGFKSDSPNSAEIEESIFGSDSL